MSDRAVTEAIQKAVRARYCAPEWACFLEVPQATGAMGGRTADAVAMNLFPSRGLALHGVEIKASRSDWSRELKNPAKAEAIARYMDYWWIAAPKGLIKPEELPPTWGLLELCGDTLRQRVAGKRLDAEEPSRAFIAAMLRRAEVEARRDVSKVIEAATAAAREEAREAREESWKARQKAERYDRLKEKVDNFEKASGFAISDRWGYGPEVGKAVRLVLKLGVVSTYGTLRGLVSSARRFSDEIEASLGEMADGE